MSKQKRRETNPNTVSEAMLKRLGVSAVGGKEIGDRKLEMGVVMDKKPAKNDDSELHFTDMKSTFRMN